MPGFICPVCGQRLAEREHSLVCESSHSFDIARQGYVHLVRPDRMHSKNPGDTKLMVDSRRAFLSAGYYDIFSDALCGLCAEYAGGNPVVLDCGCGEGYYTGKLKAALPQSEVLAFDISKTAVKAAAGKYKDISFAVASVFSIPVADSEIDILTDVFSPLAESEFLRVLKSGGVFIYAVPGERHLWGLKEIIYDNPYENEHKDTDYDGFTLLKRVPVKGKIKLESHEQIMNLFSMTPYYWKTSEEDVKKLENLCELETEIHFDFLVYRKN